MLGVFDTGSSQDEEVSDTTMERRWRFTLTNLTRPTALLSRMNEPSGGTNEAETNETSEINETGGKCRANETGKANGAARDGDTGRDWRDRER